MSRFKTILLVAASLSASASFAQMYQADSNDAAPAEELFQACGFCHGDQGQGRQRLDAPAFAGLNAWYLERQMHNFDSGIRGAHADDLPGSQMAMITGMFRNDATIKGLAEYIESLTPGAPPMTRGQGENAQPEPTERPFIWNSKYANLDASLPGDPVAGEKIYQATCLACHGAQAQGVEGLSAPKLTVQPWWYLARELQYFRDGVRGADTRDSYGIQMAVFGQMLVDDQAIANVIAYIETL